jgi:hypothetical protein
MVGGPPVGFAVEPCGTLGGVHAQKVMEGVPAGRVLGQQVRVGQLSEQRRGARCGYGEAGRRRYRHVRPGTRSSNLNSRAAAALSAWYENPESADQERETRGAAPEIVELPLNRDADSPAGQCFSSRLKPEGPRVPSGFSPRRGIIGGSNDTILAWQPVAIRR